MSVTPPELRLLLREVSAALEEDLGSGDVSAALLADRPARARLIVREAAVLCGQAWASACFGALDREVSLDWKYPEGSRVEAGATVLEVAGRLRALLSAERSALNFLQLLSGTATTVAAHVASIAHTRCRLLDTRKTLPGLRHAQKYAVRVGGGHNHRMGLYDAILLKENHLAAAGSVAAAVQAARQRFPKLPLEVEVERLDQLEACLALGVPRVLLDNFDLATTREAVALAAGRCELEASGGLDEAGLVARAEAGVDFVSLGSLTKHVRAIDCSLRLC